ncbi:MAG: DUF1549 domain-containing protein [Fuerstiella sp.]
MVASFAQPVLSCLLVSAAFLLPGLCRLQAQPQPPSVRQLQFFETHVRPLLHSRCVKCHGENQQKGGLRLDSVEHLLKGGESGAAAVPGKPAESLLLEAVRYESFEMPPDKPLSAEEISHLETWISEGVAWPTLDGVSVRLTGAAFTDDERNFWSLKPLTNPQSPTVSTDWGQNDIDHFVLVRLESAGIRPAPAADDRVLVRRLYFDLLGLPPSPDEVTEFLNSKAPNRWSALVDQLLADPRYGEHWGRYWLDVVRYAESDGFRADSYRPDAWRYRDYVVNAFNNDKPYDQFILEQLAGDEVAPHKAEALVATGYLRTWLYEYNQRDARTQWQDILNQVTDVTGEAFLGVSVACARCHDHKFDPILQEDYYRLQSCFGNMIPRDDIPAADLEDRQQYALEYEAWLAKGAELRQQLKQIRRPYMERAARGAIEKFPEDIQQIMALPPDQRTPLQGQLADLVNRQVIFDQNRARFKDKDQKRIDELEKQIAELAGREPARLPSAMTVADLGNTPQTMHLGANPELKPVVAGGLSILDPAPFERQPTADSTGQRTALARWIASPDNPLTARVIVNRIWQRHFGTGLVDTASDFGSLGGRPSHPQLLDRLASEFIAHGYSIKWLHRQILNSATWQMSAFHPEAALAEQTDPGNRLRWRFAIRRLNAEQIRDAMLTASGELQSEQGGPSVPHDSLRRSLYLKMMRNTPEPLLRSLDGVDGLNSIPKRSTTTTPTQALNLMNGKWVRQRSMAMARRILDEVSGATVAELVDNAFQIALGRHADDSETSVGIGLINDAASQSAESDAHRPFALLSTQTRTSARVNDTTVAPLSARDQSLKLTSPFTFLGVIHLESLYADATVRTIVSQWNSNNRERGWAIGVTSEKSAYKPRNLILQVVGKGGYEVVASNLRPELHTTYMVAVTVASQDDGTGQAAFWLQPLNPAKGGLQHAVVSFKSAQGLSGNVPLVLGGRSGQERHRWDGQLDQTALFSRRLNPADIQKLFAAQLNTSAVTKTGPVAAWDFNNSENPVRDVSGHGHDLTMKENKSFDPRERALADLCHVLLNSNEFVYID